MKSPNTKSFAMTEKPDSLSNSFQANRRTVLTAAVAGGSAALAGSLNAQTANATNTTMPGESKSPVQQTSYELSERTLDELQQSLQSGEFTSKGLVEKYLVRIAEIDPHLGSIIETNPDAEAIASQFDQERAAGKLRGPLHGIPILVKDNLDTADRMRTTAGSLALMETPKPTEDSFVVQKLRQAGAIILGKTNLSEWANIRSTSSTSGWSGRGGQTNNPYALDRNPCGSSSGSGVAVAASLATAAIGTETNGSITCPSACCSLVGIKPTVGLVSRRGIIPISHSQDTAGPMARTVREAAIVLSAIAGSDSQDAVTFDADKHLQDYTKSLDPNGLQGAKVGVARNFFGEHPGIEGLLETALEAIKQAGAELIDTEGLAVTDEAGEASGTVLEYELKHDMAAYLSRLGPDSPMKTLQDLINFNEANRDKELQYFGQEFFLAANERGPLTDYEYIEARNRCLRFNRSEGIDKVADELELDCFVAPVIGLPCLTDLINGDKWGSYYSPSPAAIAGYPSITVPAGYFRGLPLGLLFFGKAWTEPKLIKMAYAFEQATKYRKPPEFLYTADLGE
ncbi:MAG: amidase [Planctomycetota bacterium]